MLRTTNTMQRVETEAPINPSVVSLQVGVQLIKKQSFLGVGQQHFLKASDFIIAAHTGIPLA